MEVCPLPKTSLGGFGLGDRKVRPISVLLAVYNYCLCQVQCFISEQAIGKGLSSRLRDMLLANWIKELDAWEKGKLRANIRLQRLLHPMS